MVTQGRYQRNIDIPGFGTQGQERLLRARVLVVGAGGLGSAAALYLAAAGVGRIGIVDHDSVEVANLQRQVIHDMTAVGQNKAESAAARLAALNPDVVLQPYPVRIDKDNGLRLIRTHDLVLDCTDAFSSKMLISDLCHAAEVPVVWGAAVGMTYQVSVFGIPVDGHRASLRDLYPAEPDPADYPQAGTVGVLGAMVGQAGAAMATEAIKVLTGLGVPLAGRLLIADVAAGRWDVVKIR